MKVESPHRFPVHEHVLLTDPTSLQALAYCWGLMSEEEREVAIKGTRAYLTKLSSNHERRVRMYGDEA